LRFEFELRLLFHKEQNYSTTFLKLNFFPPTDEFMKVFTHFGPSQRANILKRFHIVWRQIPEDMASSLTPLGKKIKSHAGQFYQLYIARFITGLCVSY